ncbi:hypothetical protein WHR41_03671 [Cladosporium halotolerans]|uniref:Uncharacterized protein n=1 Tax=Cladosporium halotolerans TaxID=1052096 RepID=A0AB34KRH2_9PEZI
MSPPKGPYTLLTVNNAPERATRLVSRVVETVKEQYTIRHVANAESPEAAPALLEQHKPDIVFTASMWSPSQSASVMSAARAINPAVKTLALPQGLQVERGPDAVVEFIVGELPGLIEG